MKKVLFYSLTIIAILFLNSGCTEEVSEDDFNNTVKSYNIGGTASNIKGDVVIKNGSDTLTLHKNDTRFKFTKKVANGSSYNVTIKSAPNYQTCTLTNASGKVNGADVSNVKVICVDKKYSISFKVNGLDGALSVLMNGANSMSISHDGTYTFSKKEIHGFGYNVTINSQPSNQECTVYKGVGTVDASNINNIEINCTTAKYSIGGTASNIKDDVVIKNGSDTLTLHKNDTRFKFTKKVANGSSYNVTIKSAPNYQTCTLTNASGTVNSADVSNVQIACVDKKYSISFKVNGLDGGLSVLMNGSNYIGLSNNGTYTFSKQVVHGFDYNVTVNSKPDKQECSVYKGVGTVDASNINNIDINCTTVKFSIGGTKSGIDSGKYVIIQNNNGDDLNLSASGSSNFKFNTLLNNGSTYNVTVKTQPVGQVCSITNGSGTVNGADINNVQVNCAATSGKLSAKVKDLNGTIKLKEEYIYNGSSSYKEYEITNNGTITQELENNIHYDTNYTTSIVDYPEGQTCKLGDYAKGAINTNNSHPTIQISCKNLPVPPSTIPFVIKVKPRHANGEYFFAIFARQFMDFLYDVDCDNDGVYEAKNIKGDHKCLFDSGDEQTVSIKGNYPSIAGHYHDCSRGGTNEILSVEQWGDQHWLTMENAFGGCRDLKFNAEDKPDLSHVTSMSGMFHGAENFNSPINDWNTSSVTSMESMFYIATKFNQPLNNWDTSSVTTMNFMFSSATNFNQPLNNWDTSSVKFMGYMFSNTKLFNQNLSSWNTSNVINMEYMFGGAEKFNQPLNNWDTSKVTWMDGMFYRAKLFNKPLNNWNVGKVTRMYHMFNGAEKFNQPLNNWDTSNVINMNYMFNNAQAFDQDLSGWDVSKVNSHSHFDDNSPIEGTAKEPNWP
ncbi:MAG: hypothetical protein DSY76_03115 [Bacteroidetes bacterium]|nr:MAG: hypothetical protein DSY76_03115 [Bacteroidota bacterium]